MNISDIEPGFVEYKYVRDGNFEKIFKGSQIVDYHTCLKVIELKHVNFFPFLEKSLNSFWNPTKHYCSNIPQFFMLKFNSYDIKTLKYLIPYLNLELKEEINNYSILFRLNCDLERFKLFFDEFKRRGIPIENELLEFYIREDKLSIVQFLKCYITVKPEHIKLALKMKKSPIWFETLKTNYTLYPEILVDAIYNPIIFEKIFKQLRTIFPLLYFKYLFYDETLMKIDFAVKFLLDKGVPKPSMDYLTISSLNLNNYYVEEINFIQKIFTEEGIGRIIKTYILP